MTHWQVTPPSPCSATTPSRACGARNRALHGQGWSTGRTVCAAPVWHADGTPAGCILAVLLRLLHGRPVSVTAYASWGTAPSTFRGKHLPGFWYRSTNLTVVMHVLFDVQYFVLFFFLSGIGQSFRFLQLSASATVAIADPEAIPHHGVAIRARLFCATVVLKSEHMCRRSEWTSS